MKTLKLMDIAVSVGLIVGFTAYYIAYPDFDRMILSYLITGGWQVLSMIAHIFNRKLFHGWNIRVWYSLISLVLLVTMPAGSVWILVFVAWPMAIFYTVFCYTELKKI